MYIILCSWISFNAISNYWDELLWTSMERLIVLLLVIVWNASMYSLLWLLFSYYKTVVSLN